MALDRPAAFAQPREIIQVDSDSDSDSANEVQEIPRPLLRPRSVADFPPRPELPAFAGPAALDDALAAGDFAAVMAEFAEEDAEFLAEVNRRQMPADPVPEAARPMTEDECLAKVLEIYPEISHDHVRSMFRGGLEVGMQPDSTWCEQLVVRILDEGRYPTEREAQRAALKRKREPSEDAIERNPMQSGPCNARRAYQSVATKVLQSEYPEIPVRFIDQTLREQASFFKAFLLLEEAERTFQSTDAPSRPYKKVRRRDPKPTSNPYSRPQDTAHTAAMDKVKKELVAAKNKIKDDAVTRQKEDEKREEEDRNTANARANDGMAECVCCFDEYPTNRMAFCNGNQVHFYCHGCARSWVNAQLDDGKCYPKCCGGTNCGAEITKAQLRTFLDPKVLARLERLQQRDDLLNAGIEGLVECPFCNFAAECQPIDVDWEFRCQAPDCGVVSCRRCRMLSHPPKTCEEAEKDRKGDARHKVEEAMSNALIRVCNKCKTPFMKEIGCNKMTCGKCGNTQCYVCAKNVRGYDHFGESAGKCPVYDDNPEKRHHDEVKAAETAAVEAIKRDNPEVTEDDLKIQVSERVREAEQRRIANAARNHGNPYGPGRMPPIPLPHGHVPHHLPAFDPAVGAHWDLHRLPRGIFPPLPPPPPPRLPINELNFMRRGMADIPQPHQGRAEPHGLFDQLQNHPPPHLPRHFGEPLQYRAFADAMQNDGPQPQPNAQHMQYHAQHLQNNAQQGQQWALQRMEEAEQYRPEAQRWRNELEQQRHQIQQHQHQAQYQHHAQHQAHGHRFARQHHWH